MSAFISAVRAATALSSGASMPSVETLSMAMVSPSRITRPTLASLVPVEVR